MEFCELDTADILEIIQSCPELTELELEWNIGWGNFTGQDMTQSSKQDWRVRLGEIADALAKHIPNLRVLKMASAVLEGQHPSSDHPYAIGKALQQPEHLRHLQLDHHAIYGPESGEDDVSLSGLADVIPRCIEELEIGPNAFGGEPGEEIEPLDAWTEWQIDDLNQILQNESFGRLRHLDLILDDSSVRRHIHHDTIAKYGWEVVRDEPEAWVYKLEK